MIENTVYTDGQQLEEKIIHYLKAHDGNSAGIIDSLPEGAVFHNFTSARENLINWYPFSSQDTVLEIGAGMGALTPYLARTCKSVTSVEPADMRAQIIRCRCSGFSNVTVKTSLEELDPDIVYDYVMLIGVLEYAAVTVEGENPWLELLDSACRKLKTGGKLLLAIENKYGLKYWCGAAEDHTSIPFDSISDYQYSMGKTKTYGASQGVRTFSHAELAEMLHDAGLPYLRFYYPMPDYKFPALILTDESSSKSELIRDIKLTYPEESTLIADERKLYPEIIENDVFDFFANSFFIEASGESFHRDIVTALTKRDYKAEYRLATIICADQVFRYAAVPQAKKHLQELVDNTETLRSRGIKCVNQSPIENGYTSAPKIQGERADIALHHASVSSDESLFYSILDRLKEAVEKSSEYTVVDGTKILKHGYLDLSLKNSFWMDGQLLFFDQEWDYPDIPVGFVLFRSVRYSLDGDARKKAFRYLGITATDEIAYEIKEQAFFSRLMDETNCKWFDHAMFHSGLTLDKKREAEGNNLRAHIEQLIESERHLIDQLAEKSGWIAEHENQLEQLIESERHLIDQLAEKSGWIAEHENQLAILSAANQEYELLKHSRSWRILETGWKIRDILVPKGSLRRQLAKQLVKDPSHILSLFKPLTIPDCSNPTVSIVIPAYNQFGYTYGCIRSIIENSGDVPYEVILADDCSTDLTRIIHHVVRGLHTVRNKENLRFLRNCNHAAKSARGKYILFLNNDTKVQKYWLIHLVKLIESADDIGMVGSKLVCPDGTLQEAGGIIWRDGTGWNYGRGGDPNAPEYNYVKEVDYISGAAIMIRRSLWEEIGGFDERFAPAYCEDSDLAFEVRKHGYRVMYQPLSTVIHFEGVSNGTDLSAGQKAYQIANQKKLYEKWKDVLQREHFPNSEKIFLARERGMGKRVLLFIDHYVPHYDRDAGSRTIFQYLSLFVDVGYHVKFIGDNFALHQPYACVLQQMGIEVLYGNYYAEHWKEWLGESAYAFDYCFLSRSYIAVKYIDAIRAVTKARIVYYGHDLAFLRGYREYEVTGNEETLRQAEEIKGLEFSVMRRADASYYPSPVEEATVKEIDSSILVRTVPAYIYQKIEPVQYIAERRRDLMFIGGFGHPPNVDAVLWFHSEVLPKLQELVPGIVTYILGSNAPEEILTLTSQHLKVIGFVTDEELEQYYSSCRAVIAPLRFGAGIKGKIVEAMKHGMPVITTTIGAEGLEGAEEVLAIADTADAFAEKIAELYQDSEMLEAKSSASVQYVMDHFTPESAKRAISAEFDFD